MDEINVADTTSESPETYWEKRCSVTEQALGLTIQVLVAAMPHQKEPFFELLDTWQKAIDEIPISPTHL